MQTLTIKINNVKAIKLLEDLEELNLLQVIKKPLLKGKKLPEQITEDIFSKKISRRHKNFNSLDNGQSAPKTKNASLRKLLLNGPVFSDEQIKTIENTHKSINEWRTK